MMNYADLELREKEDEQFNSTLLLRLIVFSIFPLMFAVRLLRASKAPVTKLGLKAPDHPRF